MTKKKDKSGDRFRRVMPNNTIAGIDLGDSSSLATVLSPMGDITERFSFQMDASGYALFQERVPKDARIAYEATTMAYPFSSSQGSGIQ